MKGTQTAPGQWFYEPNRHVFEANDIDPRLPNRFGPQAPGSWLYVQLDGRAISLSGHVDQGDGTVFEWRGGN